MATTDVDVPGEITVTKRLEHTSPGERRAAEGLRRRQANRHQTAADSLATGGTPMCDWPEPGGRSCELPAVWMRHGSPGDDELLLLCTLHRQAQELQDRQI
jgi:hypothetical protein